MMEVAISTGRAAEQLQRIIEAQGGDPRVVDDPSILPQANEVELYTAPRSGVVAHVEPRAVGRGIVALGGGRSRMEDTVDPTVGFVISARPGDYVKAGEPMATVFARNMAGVAAGMAALSEAIDNTPMPYLPASCMPLGLMLDAVAIGIRSWIGRICNAASCSVNQSLS